MTKARGRGIKRKETVQTPPFAISSPEGSSNDDLTLASDEVDDFLSFLFSDVARRPATLPLLESMAVAKYLNVLSRTPLERRRTAPKWGADERKLAQAAALEIALAICKELFVFGELKRGRKTTVEAFLRDHGRTYLASHPLLGQVQRLVQDFDIPEGTPDKAPRPSLMSGSMSQSSSEKPNFADDLSERIYVGYYALRSADVRSSRGRIAETLNAATIPRRLGKEGITDWDSGDVVERVKQFEKGKKHSVVSGDRADWAKGFRRYMLRIWLNRYRGTRRTAAWLAQFQNRSTV